MYQFLDELFWINIATCTPPADGRWDSGPEQGSRVGCAMGWTSSRLASCKPSSPVQVAKLSVLGYILDIPTLVLVQAPIVTLLHACCRRASLQARLAREGARIAAARQGERQEAAWGEATSDEDDAETARYTRERSQILEVIRVLIAC